MPSYAQIRAMFPTTYDLQPYAWIITRDFLWEEYGPGDVYVEGDPFNSEVGVRGPSQATPVQIALANACGMKFRMYDDDGELYYEGYLWTPDGIPDMMPLDDFGTPNAGATDIAFQSGDIWVSL